MAIERPKEVGVQTMDRGSRCGNIRELPEDLVAKNENMEVIIKKLKKEISVYFGEQNRSADKVSRLR